jgi:hypothetical protein
MWYSSPICKNCQVVILAPIKRLLSIKNTYPSQKTPIFAVTKPRVGSTPFDRLRPDFQNYWLRILIELLPGTHQVLGH